MITVIMIRLKFLKNYKQFKPGDTESFSRNEAFGLIDSGVAMVSKDMVASDTQQGSVISSVAPVFSVTKTSKPKRNIKRK